MPETQGMPKQGMGALVVSGIVVLLGSAAIVLRLLYEEIILTSQQGPQMIGFSMGHIMPGALILGMLFLLVLHIWLLVALATVGREAYRHRLVARSAQIVLSGALAVMILLYMPYGWWRYLIFQTVGPGPHSGSHLTYAAAMGELYNVRALMKHGVRVDATEQDGTTALMGASVAGQLSIVKYLVGAGAAVNYQGGSLARSALMNAAEMGHPDVVAYLLTAGADRTLADREGKTALDIAQEKNDKRVLAALGAAPR